MKHSKVTQKLNEKVLKTIANIEAKAKTELAGFLSISHSVKFDCFPSSLSIHCYFDNKESLESAKSVEQKYQKLLHSLMLKQGVILKNPSHHLRFSISPKTA